MAGWSDYRQRTAANMRSKSKRRYPPWQAGVLMVNAGEEFQVALVDMPPHPRPHHWTRFPHECTASNPLFEGKCVFCFDAAEKDADNEKLEAKGLDPEQYKHWLRDGLVLPVVDYRMHHFVPDPKKDGKFMVAACAYPDKDIPKGAPTGMCSHCNHKDPYVAERRFLGMRRWEVGTTSELWNIIIAADRRANQVCMHEYKDGSICRGKNFLTQIICPECGTEFMNSEQIHADAQGAAELAEKVVSCTSCDWKGKPYSAYTCMNAVKRGTDDCAEHMARPGTLADGVVNITCRGETRQGGQVVRKYTVDAVLTEDKVGRLVEGFGYDPDAAKALLSGKDIDLDRQYLPERKNPDDDAFNKNGAFNKEEYVKAVLQAQAEDLGINNPYVAGGGSHVPFGGKSRSYEGARD